MLSAQLFHRDKGNDTSFFTFYSPIVAVRALMASAITFYITFYALAPLTADFPTTTLPDALTRSARLQSRRLPQRDDVIRHIFWPHEFGGAGS